jgi:hypothetical protein
LPPHREQVETAISRPSPQVPLGPGPARGDNPGSTRAGPTPDDCEVPSGLYYPGWADRQAFHIQHTVCEAGTRYRRSEDNPAPRAGSIGRVQGSKPLGQECRRQHPGVYLLGSQIFLSPWSVVLAPELCLAADSGAFFFGLRIAENISFVYCFKIIFFCIHRIFLSYRAC